MAASLDNERSIDDFPWAYPQSSVVVVSGEEGVLGRGAYGEVRRATWCGISVACKRLHSFATGDLQAAQAMLVEEMGLLATLRHPNLVLFLGVVYDDSTKVPTSILTEVLPYSLYDLLEVHKVKLEVAEVLDVAMDVAQALKYLHSHDPAIVHRDLSSKNVLMGYGRAKLSDLGQAKMLADVNSHANANTTMPGAMAYSAPEVLTGIYDKSIDVFSFGVLVVQLVTGDFPRIERRREQLQAAIDRCPFLSALIERCLHLHAQDRPAISDVVVFLKDAMENPRLYNQEANQCRDVGILSKRSIRDTINAHMKDLRQQLAITEKRLLASEERLKAEMLRADQNAEQLQASQQVTARLQQEVAALQEQNTALQSEVTEADRMRQLASNAEQKAAETIASLEQKLTDLSRSVAKFNQELDDSNKRYEAIKQQLQVVHAEKLDLERTHMQALQGAEEMRAQLNMQLEATRELDHQLTQALHRWRAEQLSRSSGEKSLRDARRTIHSLQTEKSELVDKIQSLQQQVSAFSADSEQKASLETTVRAELEELRRRNTQLERTVERLRADATEQTKDLEAVRAALHSEALQKQEMEAQNLNLKRQQRELSEQVALLTQQLTAQEKRAAELQAQRDQLRQQLSAMHIIAEAPRSARQPNWLETTTFDATTSSSVVASPEGQPAVSNATTTLRDAPLDLETDRAVKSRVQEAIQQGPKQLLDLMEKEMADIRLAWRCMRFIKSYAQEDLKHREQLADLGVFSTMMTGLRAHHQMRDMQLEGMRAAAAVVFKSNRCRRLAGEAGLPQYACHVLNQFAADATIVAQACTALTNLTHNSFDNKDRVVEAKGLKYIIAGMDRFAGDVKVQTQAAWTLLTLAASDTVAIEIARLGGATSLVNAISHHRSNEQVVYYASWALNNLAACPELKVKDALITAGIGEACSIILDHFPSSPDIISWKVFSDEKQPQHRTRLDSQPVNAMSVSHKVLNRLLARGDLADLRAKLQLLETAARDEWVLAHKDGTTQLHKACEKGHVEVAEYLIDNGVDVNARKRDGKTPLHEACNHGHVRCAALLLERGADANAHKTNGWTAMHYAAIEDSEQLIQLLYSHGALLDEKNEDGCTALFLAAREGNASALRALINLGANPIVPMTSTRVTPIMAAAAAGKLNTFQVLLETVAHAGREEGDAVMWQVIAEGGNVEMLEQWIDQRSRSIPKAGMNNGFHRLPPLHIACTRGNVDVVRALLERQLVDPNERDVDGCTALYHAASMGAAEVVQVLLTHGAEPNSGSSRRTPLHCAVGWGHIKCAELLLRHGADRSITDDEQRTPLQLLQDMPIKRGHVEELQALLMNDNISAR